MRGSTGRTHGGPGHKGLAGTLEIPTLAPFRAVSPNTEGAERIGRRDELPLALCDQFHGAILLFAGSPL
jgi:hypothetical protein